VAVHLYNATDVETPITADGTVVPIDLTIPGRITRLPFSGTANQRLSLWVTVTGGSFGCAWSADIRRAETDVVVGSAASSCGSTAFLESQKSAALESLRSSLVRHHDRLHRTAP
jgi:hypothetical protein